MDKRYLYNVAKGKLHILGYCPYAKRDKGYIEFETENEAVVYDGRAVGWCKRCMKKREQLERNID